MCGLEVRKFPKQFIFKWSLDVYKYNMEVVLPQETMLLKGGPQGGRGHPGLNWGLAYLRSL